MESVARLKNLSASPRKMRLVADVVRNREVQIALNILKMLPQKGAGYFARLVQDAVANLRYQNASNQELLKRPLYVKEAYVDGGPVLRRIKPAPRGRAHPIRKPTCHLTVKIAVQDFEGEQQQASKDVTPVTEAPATNEELVLEDKTDGHKENVSQSPQAKQQDVETKALAKESVKKTEPAERKEK